MSLYPKTEPYVYCGLAEASYDAVNDPISSLKNKYRTNMHKHMRVVDKICSNGWDYVLFENTQNNSLIVAFRGTDIANAPSEMIEDIFNEIGKAEYKPVIKAMSKQISHWLDTYNKNGQYDEVSFVGHSEGGLFARFVLYNDERIHFRVTFNTAKPRDCFNFRSKGDPISLITGFAEREKDILFDRDVPNSDVWTICSGIHTITNFNKEGILFEGDHRKTWEEVRELTHKYEEDVVENGVFVKKWWDEKHKREKIEKIDLEKRRKRNLIIITSIIVLACSYFVYHKYKE